MPKVRLLMPPDSTFLSSVLYEGLLYLVKNSASRFDFREIDFESEFLSRAYKELEDSKIDKIRIVMTGNDNINTKLFEKLGVQAQSRKTFYDLLKLLKENFASIKSKEVIDLELKIAKKDNLIDIKKKSDGIAAPQLLKIDRYTGLSSLETEFTSQQLTLYTSAEVVLIALLGIYSSFVCSIRQQQQNYYFFLFFSPDEVLKMLGTAEKEFVRKCMMLKENAMEELRNTIMSYPSNELIALNCALNLKLRELLESENIEKISLLLFKIAPEGNTYKIYETIPIEIYRKLEFYEIARKYFREPDNFVEELTKALSPQGVILKALASLNWQNRYAEAENVLSAIHGLYRFVASGDAQGYFEFMKSLENASEKAENEGRAQEYRKLIARLG